MNKARILELADFIYRRIDLPWDFNLHEHCAIGFASQLWGSEHGDICTTSDLSRVLGISRELSRDLFVKSHYHGRHSDLSDVPREAVVFTLRRLAASGLSQHGEFAQSK